MKKIFDEATDFWKHETRWALWLKSFEYSFLSRHEYDSSLNHSSIIGEKDVKKSFGKETFSILITVRRMVRK